MARFNARYRRFGYLIFARMSRWMPDILPLLILFVSFMLAVYLLDLNGHWPGPNYDRP